MATYKAGSKVQSSQTLEVMWISVYLITQKPTQEVLQFPLFCIPALLAGSCFSADAWKLSRTYHSTFLFKYSQSYLQKLIWWHANCQSWSFKMRLQKPISDIKFPCLFHFILLIEEGSLFLINGAIYVQPFTGLSRKVSLCWSNYTHLPSFFRLE